MRAATTLCVLVLILGLSLRTQGASINPAFINYDVRLLPSYYREVSNYTETQYLVKQINTAGALGVKKLQYLFQGLQGSKYANVESDASTQAAPKFTLFPVDLMERYGGNGNPAVALRRMAPAILACKLDQDCAYDTGVYPLAATERRQLMIIKVVFAIFFIFEHLFGVFVPYFITKIHKRGLFYLGIVSTFSAGVLLSAALLELLAESMEHTYQIPYIYNDFPVAPAIALGAYLFVFFFDRVLFDPQQFKNAINDEYKRREIALAKDPKGYSMEKKKGASFKSLSRPIILLGAFILHAILEFISMGIQTNVRALALLIVAVGITEAPEYTAIATFFIRAGANLKQLLAFMVPFSVIPSAFMLAGLALTYVTPALNMAFLALATGTFIFISCNEIIAEEMEQADGSRSGLKGWQEKTILYCCVVFGALVFIVAKLIPGNYTE